MSAASVELLDRLAGADLDALIAQSFFGATNVQRRGYEGDGAWKESDAFFGTFTAGARLRVPPYSTELAAAWTVVERLVAKGMKIGVSDRPGRKWGFWICRDPGQPEETIFFRTAETPAHAICLAALDAVAK